MYPKETELDAYHRVYALYDVVARKNVQIIPQELARHGLQLQRGKRTFFSPETSREVNRPIMVLRAIPFAAELAGLPKRQEDDHTGVDSDWQDVTSSTE